MIRAREEGEGGEGDRGLALEEEMERGRKEDSQCLRTFSQEAPGVGPNTADPPSSPWCAWEHRCCSLQP